jgi:hypothetical protein
MTKKTTQKKLAPPAESEGSTEESSSESEETPDPPSADETDEGTTTKTTETPSEEESEEDETDEEEPEEKPKKKDEKDKDKKPRKPVDPVVLDYAEHLKAQLGKEYDKELDSLPLRARISAMKVLVKLKNKPPNLTEGHPPKGGTTPAKPVKVGGYNFKELGQKY